MFFFLAQDKFDKKFAEVTRLEDDILKIDRELMDCKTEIAAINERWKIADISIDKLKWMGEKARIVLESNGKINELQHSKTMETIERNHLDLTARAFKTVRQEAARAMINAEINNLADNKTELRNKLFSLRKIKTKNENDLATASMELIGIKVRATGKLKEIYKHCTWRFFPFVIFFIILIL